MHKYTGNQFTLSYTMMVAVTVCVFVLQCVYLCKYCLYFRQNSLASQYSTPKRQPVHILHMHYTIFCYYSSAIIYGRVPLNVTSKYHNAYTFMSMYTPKYVLHGICTRTDKLMRVSSHTVYFKYERTCM
jgi:hypothetical protein